METTSTRLSVKPRPPFHFGLTAYSHGWVVLAPNRWEADRQAVYRVERLDSGRVVLLEITGNGSLAQPEIFIDVHDSGTLSSSEAREIREKVTWMFRAEEDLSEFYARCRDRGEPWQKLTQGWGRLLRSPRVLEDVIKCICTTNIQWSGTKRLVQGLVETFGEPYPAEPAGRAFPTAETLAAAPPEAFTERVRLGYRGPYVHTLAEQVAAGKLDLEALRDPAIPTAELKKALLAIKGVGPYAAATLLILLGHYDELAVDSVFRTFVTEKYFQGQRPGDAEARAVYDDWGKWKALACWFDIWQGLDEKL